MPQSRLTVASEGSDMGQKGQMPLGLSGKSRKMNSVSKTICVRLLIFFRSGYSCLPLRPFNLE